MNCGRFVALLDAHFDAHLDALLDVRDTTTLGAEALEHAAACEFCARALVEARALEQSLDAHFADHRQSESSVPPAFTDRLMARVEAMPQVRLAPAEVLRGALASFASPPIAASGIAAVLLLGFAVSARFDLLDLKVLAARASAATAPLTRLLAMVSSPLPAPGLAHDLALASLALATLPALVLLAAAAWQVGNLIGERPPRTL